MDDGLSASVSSVVLESMVGKRESPENKFSSSLRAFNSSGVKDFSLDPNILSSSDCCEIPNLRKH